jgi:hypothetical protein
MTLHVKRQMIGSAEGSLAQLALEGSITSVLPAFPGFEAVIRFLNSEIGNGVLKVNFYAD